MLKLMDGPCEGTYLCKFAPERLMAVMDRGSGKKDVLDAPGDTASVTEDLHVYQRIGGFTTVHINLGAAGQGLLRLRGVRIRRPVHRSTLERETPDPGKRPRPS